MPINVYSPKTFLAQNEEFLDDYIFFCKSKNKLMYVNRMFLHAVCQKINSLDYLEPKETTLSIKTSHKV